MIDVDKVKRIVDTLVKGQVVDKIMSTMDHGFGDIVFKVTVINGSIKIITTTDTKTVKMD